MYAAFSIVFIALLFFLHTAFVFAQTQESNAVATRVGNPAELSSCGINRVFYAQGDPQYQNSCDMAGSGCGPTSMAMILSSYGDTITPNAMDVIFRQRGWRGCGDGSAMVTAITTYLPERGYTYVNLPISKGQLDLTKAKEYLNNGYLIIGSTSRHIFVMYDADIDSNTVQLMDPARRENAPGVTRPNAFPWIVSDGGWFYAYAVKKEGVSCDMGPLATGVGDSVCQGTALSFGEKKLLPRQSQLTCKATDTGSCGRLDKCRIPRKVVLHTTVSPATAEGIYDYFAKGAGGRGVGTQFVIGKDGKVIQMTEMFDKEIEESVGTAYHNAEAINIEMTDTGVYASKDAAPNAQYQAMLSLVKKLMQQYNIPKGNVGYDWKASSDSSKDSPPGIYGHYQLNPSNRTDPGIGFMRDFLADL